MGPAEVPVTTRYSQPGRLLSLHDPVDPNVAPRTLSLLPFFLVGSGSATEGPPPVFPWAGSLQ